MTHEHSIKKLEDGYLSIGYQTDAGEWHETQRCLDPQMAESLRRELSRMFYVEFDREYVLRMPASEAMMSCRRHGHLQRIKVQAHTSTHSDGSTYVWFNILFPSETTGEWYASGYTYSEVGLYHGRGGLYGYLPDLSEDPAEIQAYVEKVRQDLDAILTNAGAMKIDPGVF